MTILQRMRTSRVCQALLGGVLLLGLAVPAAAESPSAPVLSSASVPVGGVADDGARVIAEETVGPRIVDLTIDSPALGTTAKVRLLLPSRWSAKSARTWPVLYLLHGAWANYTIWTGNTDVEALTENTDVLVVMPAGGLGGYYSDWWNFGLGGTPGWETFHLTELRQILERGYRAGTQRAIAGLSMGGFGAMSYAARHPGMFAAAGSYSGAVHTQYNPPMGSSIIQAAASSDGRIPTALWGDPVLQRDIWAAHNPYDLAPLLRGTKLYVASGNGQPGPLDAGTALPDTVEQVIGEMSSVFVQRLRELGADVTANLYGPGTHNWPYWQRELHSSFPMLMKAIGVRTEAR